MTWACSPSPNPKSTAALALRNQQLQCGSRRRYASGRSGRSHSIVPPKANEIILNESLYGITDEDRFPKAGVRASKMKEVVFNREDCIRCRPPLE